MNYLRGCAWFLGGLIAILLVCTAGIYLIVEIRLRSQYKLPEETLAIPADNISIERGEHLVTVLLGCTDCHGPQLQGKYLFDDPYMGRIVASNLTSGRGGIGSTYNDLDWERAIRHGIGPDGRPLIYVMSSYYYALGDEDVTAMIAYLKQVPAFDNELPKTTVGFISRILVLIEPTMLPAQQIEHSHGSLLSPEPGVNAEYGRYLATACSVCHKPDFSGGLTVNSGLNLTLGGDLQDWTLEDFRNTLRTGVTPSGYRLDSSMMPYYRFSSLADEELEAIWLYLQSLPSLPGRTAE